MVDVRGVRGCGGLNTGGIAVLSEGWLALTCEVTVAYDMRGSGHSGGLFVMEVYDKERGGGDICKG